MIIEDTVLTNRTAKDLRNSLQIPQHQGLFMSLRVLFPLVASVLVFAASPVSAQMGPEPKTPYLWRIVLRTQPHPLLSQTFREQLKRDLEASLQPALGTLGTVDVIDLAEISRDKWDPLWQQFDDKGFAALDAPRDLTVTKTHFLKLEYKDGLYLLEARQHDGFTGLSSGYAGFGAPVIRKQSVHVPELVGRTAGLLIDRDFGLDGTVEPILGNPKEVKVIIRGGLLGPVDQFVKVGDVFAVSEVFVTSRKDPEPTRTSTGKVIASPAGSTTPKALTSKRRSNSLIKVIDLGTEGILRCEVLGQPFQVGQGNIAGFRCLKLGTINGPLTVRLVSKEGSSTKAAGLVSVRATEKGFEAPEVPGDTLEFKDGVFRSGRPLSNVACVTVALGPTLKKRFSIPILSSDTVNLPVEIDPKAEEQAAFALTAVATITRVTDARFAQGVCFEATSKLIDKRKNTEALARAKSGFQAAEASKMSIEEELKHLRETADKLQFGHKVLKSIEQQLDALKQFNLQLEAHIKTLEIVVTRENDPSKAAQEIQAQELLGRIDILLSRGDVDQALTAYDQLVQMVPENADFKAKREKLKADWAPKSDAHAKARNYLLKTWPAITTIPDFKESVPELTRCVEECKKNGDRYALLKLLVIFGEAAGKLNELAAPLDSNTDADRKLLSDAKAAGEALAAKEIEVQEFVKKGGK
jgi:tetratricopeptide (TPR) repeat protein